MKTIAMKIALLMLAMLMALSAFVACGGDEPVVDGTGDSSSSVPGVTEPEESTPTESETEPEEVVIPVEDVIIAENNTTQYKVVRPQTPTAGETEATATIVRALKEKIGGDILASDDWVNEALGYKESEFEIIVGKTARAASDKIYSTLRTLDYSVSIVGKQIVIAAINDEKLLEAVDYFLESLTVADGKVSFLADSVKTVKADYELESITIDGAELSGYKVVYKSGAGEAIKNAAKAVSEKLVEYGYDIKAVMDSADETEYEIVICDTNRGNSKEENGKLLTLDYKIYAEGKKIYILAGANPDSVNAAVEVFLGKLEALKSNGKIEITADNIKTEFYSDTYKTKQLLINGVDVKEYSIVYANGDKQAFTLASNLGKIIEDVCGRRLNLVSDNRAYTGGKEILVGYSKRLSSAASAINSKVSGLGDNEYLLFSEGDFVFAGGNSGENAALTAAVRVMTDAILGISDPESAEISFTLNKAVKVSGTKYSIITYNDGDNSYQNIADRMTIMKEYMPDIICFQETQTPHAKKYKDSLREYDYVLYDNDGTTYNSQPVFWKKDKFELVDSGIRWLSDTPNVRSKYAESDYTRSFTYAVLRDKITGEEIVIISTHTDYVQTAVVKQTARLMELVTELGLKDKPVLILGDFNMRDNSTGYANMSNENFIDAGRYLGASKTAQIDFIFADVTQVVPTGYKVIDDHELSKVASDHAPVYAEFITNLK